MRTRIAMAAIVVAALIGTTYTSAQEWRGMGRISGTVTDEKGIPLEGVTVKVMLGTSGGKQGTTNKKGEFAIGGLARGEWQVDFEKAGYDTRKIAYGVSELGGNKPVTINMTKTAVTLDPNIALRADLERAGALMQHKDFAGARALYEGLLAQYPEARQLLPLIARTYYSEKNLDKALELLRLALAKDPENFEVKLLLGNLLIENKQADEGKQILATLDDLKVTDALIFVNIGIAMINQGKSEEAIVYFEKAIARFPNSPDAYYYRGISRLQTGRNDEAKADLTKFIALAPDAPEAATARKILEQLK